MAALPDPGSCPWPPAVSGAVDRSADLEAGSNTNAGVEAKAKAEGEAKAAIDADLDLEAAAICHRLAGRLFPWDISRALELALLKTFCVPSIAGLLDRSGEFNQRPRKRYDDTALMVAELLRHGPDSAAGAAVIARMNRIHGHYAISNHDFLYVLSTFVAEPIHWLERYGWRSLSPCEQQALHRFWRRVGQRMGIQQIPDSLEALLAFSSTYEADHFAAADCNHRVAEATVAMLLRDWPPPLRPLLGRLLRALPDTAVRSSLGWPQPAPVLPWLIRTLLRWRSRLANRWQRLQPPRDSRFYSQQPTPSYGADFQLEQLGPPALLSQLNSPERNSPPLNSPRLNSQRLSSPRWSGDPPQRRIGLTGGIASGKSSVGALLQAHGWPVLDADLYARQALAPGSPGARALLARHGAAVRQSPSGSGSESEPVAIDRAALGRIVFADAAERRWLEQLVHPLVRAHFTAELERLQNAATVVLMIPLLFETGLETLCSEVWLVDCEPQQQLQRLMARNGLPEAEAQARLEAQWPLARKRPLADRLIDNRGTPEALVAQVQALLQNSTPSA
ncbi:MAG: dephospho-CoA kinase [Cyanobium sp.]